MVGVDEGGLETERTSDVMKKHWPIGCGRSRGVSEDAKVLRKGNPSSDDRSKHSEALGA